MLSDLSIHSCSEYLPRYSRSAMMGEYPSMASKMLVTPKDSYSGYVYTMGGDKYYCCAEIYRAIPDINAEENISCPSGRRTEKDSRGGYEGRWEEKTRKVNSRLFCNSTYHFERRSDVAAPIDPSLSKTIFRLHTGGSCDQAFDCVIYTECGAEGYAREMAICNALLHHIALENSVKYGTCVKNYEGYVPRCHYSSVIKESAGKKKCKESPLKDFCIGASAIAGGAVFAILGGGAMGFIVGALVTRSISARIFKSRGAASSPATRDPEEHVELKTTVAKAPIVRTPHKNVVSEESARIKPKNVKERVPLNPKKGEGSASVKAGEAKKIKK